MWFPTPRQRPDWSAAQRHLRRAHPDFVPLIARVGPCTLAPRRDHFVALAQSIFSQQISTAVAAVLFARFRQHFPRRQPTPARVLKFLQQGGAETISNCGLSRQKRAYLCALAEHFVAENHLRRPFAGMDDEQVIADLTCIKGVGRWTAEMFLIFALNRPDVLPVDDLGLRKGIQRAFALKDLPDAHTCRQLAEPWRPYRTIATWYLWRGA